MQQYNTATEIAIRDKSKVEQALESLFARSQQLENRASTLIDRIQPVSSPQPPQPTSGTSPISPCKSQGYMLDQLDMIEAKINSVEYRINAAIDMLEI